MVKDEIDSFGEYIKYDEMEEEVSPHYAECCKMDDEYSFGTKEHPRLESERNYVTLVTVSDLSTIAPPATVSWSIQMIANSYGKVITKDQKRKFLLLF